MAPGILYVTMQPKKSIPVAQFQDWYNNEHGPLRLRLSFCHNGFRYHAADLDGPGKGQDEWMAIYDLESVEGLNSPEYMKLRGPPCQTDREREIRPHLDINRRAFDFISEKSIDGFNKIEENVGSEDEGNVMVAVCLTLKPGRSEEELDRWYNEEHIPMLTKVPGWRRTRRFKTASIDMKEGTEVEYLALYDYAKENGLGGPEFQAARDTPWSKEILGNAVSKMHRRVWDLYYTFGPAPRHLANPADWDAQAIKTRTYPASHAQGSTNGALESYITTPDGAELPYRLEGSSDPNAPVIVCINSVLVTYGIWDNFVTSLLSNPSNTPYRILRYNSRGRSSLVGNTPVTLDLLASDTIHLLNALRIPRAALAIGVSLGGATVLNLALRHPTRIARFLSCDTNAASPPGNSKAWGERIAMAEKDETFSAADNEEQIIGESLAEATTRRWFVAESYDGGKMEEEVRRVKEMVRTNSLEGFKKGVQALFEYDMNPLMKGCKVKGEFLVGAGDGALPKGMQKMALDLGDGTECTVVEGAGHLPMVEKPERVAQVVSEMLQK
ncbi:hypothetical protein MBLNU457_g0115t1 [Dothideomycetes sp. NU457]